MTRTPTNLLSSVVATVVLFSLLTGIFIAFVAPRFLGTQAPQTIASGIKVGLTTVVVIAIVAWRRVSRHRYTIRSLLLGTRSIEPDDLLKLATTPTDVTRDTLVIAFCFSLLVLLPGVRGRGVDFRSALSLSLLADMFFFTSALPLYVIVRRQIASLLALAPEQVVHEMIELGRTHPKAQHELLGRILAAIVMPVALVGLGTALLAYAHVTFFETRGRLATASAVATTILVPLPGALPHAAEKEAIAQANRLGIRAETFSGRSQFAVRHRADGNSVLVTNLGNRHARVSFAASTIPALTADSIVSALIAIAFAFLGAVLLGLSLSEDLSNVTKEIESLGMDRVLEDPSRKMRAPKFAMARSFSQAVEQLSARFRVFAETQEEAIRARENARRLRGLLFASASHDLKNALNSILGFADVIQSDLNDEQKQSLQEVKRSGRELLSLVENILDAARVEAGQLMLSKQLMDIRELVQLAVQRSDRIARPDSVRIRLHQSARTLLANVDKHRMVDAIGTLVTHARRTCKEGEVVITLGEAQELVIVDILAPSRILSAQQLRQLMLPDGVRTLPRRAGGLTLGLSLSRSILLLHGGTVTALDTQDGVVYRVTLPLTMAPAKAAATASHPAGSAEPPPSGLDRPH